MKELSEERKIVAMQQEMKLCTNKSVRALMIISIILLLVGGGLIIVPLLSLFLVKRNKNARIYPLLFCFVAILMIVGTMTSMVCNSTIGLILFGAGGAVLLNVISIAAIVFMSKVAKSFGPIATGVLQEVFDGEGKEVRENLEGRLRSKAKEKDAAGFYTELKRAHARYLARKDIILSKKQIEDLCELCVAVKGKLAGTALRDRLLALYEKRQFEQIEAFVGDFRKQYEERRQKIIAIEGEKTYTEEYGGKSTFDGSVLQRFGWSVLCGFVTLITLGIAYPATVCWKMRWRLKHTVYCGKRLSFDGTGAQLFGKWICWVLLTIVTLGIYSFWLRKKLEQWKAKHTHVAGEYAVFGGTFDGGAGAMFGVKLLAGFVSLITLGLAYPAMTCWKERWYCRHRIYDGKRLSFDGRGMQLIGKYLGWFLLTIITVGIYGLFLPSRMIKWKATHTFVSEYLTYLP